jgi:hypothetical protein
MDCLQGLVSRLNNTHQVGNQYLVALALCEQRSTRVRMKKTAKDCTIKSAKSDGYSDVDMLRSAIYLPVNKYLQAYQNDKIFE